jgi:hypothetical protein
MDNGAEMKLLEFFKNARIALEDHGDMDSAFYFEQVEDWIRSGKSLNSKSAAHILGV